MYLLSANLVRFNLVSVLLMSVEKKREPRYVSRITCIFLELICFKFLWSWVSLQLSMVALCFTYCLDHSAPLWLVVSEGRCTSCAPPLPWFKAGIFRVCCLCEGTGVECQNLCLLPPLPLCSLTVDPLLELYGVWSWIFKIKAGPGICQPCFTSTFVDRSRFRDSSRLLELFFGRYLLCLWLLLRF